MAVSTQFSSSSGARRGPPPLLYHDILRGVNLSRSAELMVTVSAISYGVWIAMGLLSSMWWVWWILPITAIPVIANALFVVIIRRANVQVTVTAYASLFAEIAASLVSLRFVALTCTYSFGAHVFYALAKAIIPNMSRTEQPEPFAPLRINERYLYVYAFATYIGVVYSLYHQYKHYDLIQFPYRYIPTLPRKKLFAAFPAMGVDAALVALVAAVSFPVVYAAFIRSFIWRISLWTYKSLLRYSLSRNEDYVRFPGRPGLVFHTFISALFLVFVWEMANRAFTIYNSGGPRHRYKFLSDLSNDANGTLLTGLKVRGTNTTKILAFQELLYIAEHSPDRRRMIYEDIDRYPKSMWSQVFSTSLAQIESIRLAFKDELDLAAALAAPEQSGDANDSNRMKPLRSLGTSSLSTASTSTTSSSAKSHFLSERVHPIHEEHRNVLQTRKWTPKSYQFAANLQDKEAKVSAETIYMFRSIVQYAQQHAVFNRLLESLLATQAGAPFRHTVDRLFQKLVPNEVLPVTVILALDSLVCHSLTEDLYGTVQRDISVLLDELDSTITTIYKFVNKPPVHWTDVLVRQGLQTANVSGAIELASSFESIFGHIIVTFERYLDELDLSTRVRARAQELLRRQE